MCRFQYQMETRAVPNTKMPCVCVCVGMKTMRDRKVSKEKAQNTYIDEHLLASVVLGLGAPRQESGNIFGQLRGGGGRAIRIFSRLVVQCLRHADGTTGEDGVEVLALVNKQTRWSILVAGKQREDVVLVAVTGEHNVAQIGWIGSIVGSTSRLLVRVGRRERVGELARTHEHLAKIIGTVQDLNLAKCFLRLVCISNLEETYLLGLGSGLLFGVRDTDQLSVTNILKTMAGSAHLLVDFEASSNTLQRIFFG